MKEVKAVIIVLIVIIMVLILSFVSISEVALYMKIKLGKPMDLGF